MKVSDEMHLRIKKGKNFKEVIADEKKKGRYVKLFMKRITSLSTSVIYGGSFLLFFATIDLTLYFAAGTLSVCLGWATCCVSACKLCFGFADN